MSLKPETEDTVEQNINALLQRENLTQIEVIQNRYVNKGLMDKKSKHDTMLTFVFAYMLGLMAGSKRLLEPEISDDNYTRGILHILDKRAPEIRDAISMYLCE